ncbi:unnamed protein product [Echinostoma caproni]|uniref:RING-type domain-containing protein n=1 Tax=Echinostoma caproni TaxID=27848 RepID=A0A3P8GQT3_9TREM|nr:unnamed protein product [Echinostoma caproni]
MLALRRDISHIPQNVRRSTGVTLNGEVVERPSVNSRWGRHMNTDPVQIDRSRLQWYDSNTRRSLAPPPPATNRSEPCGRLTASELAKLPLSTFRVQPGLLSESANSSGDSPANSSGTPVCVRNRNESNVDFSPGSAYLQPISRLATLVEIQPLQSSPGRGFPECEVCLTEYQNKDRLRHLPCGHAFHSKCIDIWFNQSSTCPKCRAGVRTGLKRLERNRARNVTANRSTVNAPVRAIRQRTAASTSVTGRRTARRNQSTSHTPIQQACRAQSTARARNQLSTSLSSSHNTSSDNSFQQTDPPGSASGAPQGSIDPDPDTNSQSQPRSSSSDLTVPTVEEVTRSASEPRSGSVSGTAPNRIINTRSTESRVSNIRPLLSGTMDKVTNDLLVFFGFSH